MRNGIKKELSMIASLGAVTAGITGNKKTALALGAGAMALYLSSRKKSRQFGGKSVVITGGSRGLGFALAHELLSEGALVTLIARDADELIRAEAKLRFIHPNARIEKVVADVTVKEELDRAFERAYEAFGSIHVLINNAGMISVGPFETMEAEDFQESLNLHLFAAMNAVKASVPYFEGRDDGQIINICSVGGLIPVPHMSTYDASKFALSGFSQAISAELAAKNVTVTTAYPSVMRTGSTGHAFFKGDAEREFFWFQLLDQMPGFSIDAAKAAKKILSAARDGDRMVVLSNLANLQRIVATVFPELMSLILETSSSFMPVSENTELRSGNEARALFDETPWTKPFQRSAREAELNYNEVPNP